MSSPVPVTKKAAKGPSGMSPPVLLDGADFGGDGGRDGVIADTVQIP